MDKLGKMLNRLSVLRSAVFQTITAFEVKLQFWQAQVMADNVMLFDTLAEHSPVSSDKYVDVFKYTCRNLRKNFKFKKKKHSLFAVPLSVNMYTCVADLEIECIELYSCIELCCQPARTQPRRACHRPTRSVLTALLSGSSVLPKALLRVGALDISGSAAEPPLGILLAWQSIVLLNSLLHVL